MEGEEHQIFENGGKMKDMVGTEETQNPMVPETTVLDHTNNGSTSNEIGGGSFSTPVSSWRPRKFLHKIWNMMENEEIKSIVSWSPSGTSFVIWNHHLFAAEVLPIYFRKSNFQSFVCQLNSYCFSKISWEQWEYKNEYFRKGAIHLLEHIKRKSQVSKNVQPVSGERSLVDIMSDSDTKIEKELETLTEEHALQKLDIKRLMEKQETLDEELVALKKHAICNAERMMFEAQRILGYEREVNDVTAPKVVDEGEASRNSTKGKRKLMEDESGRSGSDKLKMWSQFDSWCPPDDDEDGGKDDKNMFASLEYLVGESSEWAEYCRELQVKEEFSSVEINCNLEGGEEVSADYVM